MKNFLVLFLLYSTAALSQPEARSVNITHYILDTFYNGTILMKSGQKQDYMLNYNTLTHEMIFERAGERLAIAQPEDVDTVYINNRKFVYANKMFYEVLATTPVPLFIEYIGSVIRTGSEIGYGMSSSTTGSNGVSSLIQAGKMYDLHLPYDFKVKVKKKYWLRKGFNYYEANNAKHIIEVFPDKEKLIRELIKKNKTDFSNPEDITTLVVQIQS